MLNIPYFKQNRDYTCGPACLRMVLAYYGIEQDEVTLTMLCRTTLFGTSARNIEQAALQFKLQVDYKYEATPEDLTSGLQRGVPAICFVDLSVLFDEGDKVGVHAVVVCELKENEITYHDPKQGSNQKAQVEKFMGAWQGLKGELISIWRTIK